MVSTHISDSGQRSLLELPGDVRSRIMQYALTSSAPLHLVSPLKAAPEEAMRPFSALTAARLSAKRPLLVDPQSENGDGVEYNQTKYVCKMLYAETAGFELRCNDILISGEDSICKQLLQFGEYIGRKMRWLKNRTTTLHDYRPRHGSPGEMSPREIIKSHFPDTADMVAKTAWFCEAHPDITVDVGLPQLGAQLEVIHHFSIALQITIGAALTAVLRSSNLDFIVPQDWQRVLTNSIKIIKRDWLGRVLTEEDIRVEKLRYRTVEGV
jgi:hypothetical protein